MRLSDVMSHMNLATYPEIAMVIFMVVFLAVTLKVYLGRGKHYDRCATIPLSDHPIDPVNGESHG
jgi:hypothetical protein